MLRIKYDANLLKLASDYPDQWESLVSRLENDIGLHRTDDYDPYAGESLGKLFADIPETMPIWVDGTIVREAILGLRLMLTGAEIACPECGWEMALQEEDRLVSGYKCPHCSHSKLRFCGDERDQAYER